VSEPLGLGGPPALESCAVCGDQVRDAYETCGCVPRAVPDLAPHQPLCLRCKAPASRECHHCYMPGWPMTLCEACWAVHEAAEFAPPLEA
jgi:hypothetical protein